MATKNAFSPVYMYYSLVTLLTSGATCENKVSIVQSKLYLVALTEEEIKTRSTGAVRDTDGASKLDKVGG